MSIKTSPFDVAEYLQTDEDIREFLAEVLATGTSADFIHALNTAARARGMTEIARQAGVSRASLYKSLSADGNPRFETISKIVEALGARLAVTPPPQT
jgi:probable addiction module antidote protein